MPMVRLLPHEEYVRETAMVLRAVAEHTTRCVTELGLHREMERRGFVMEYSRFERIYSEVAEQVCPHYLPLHSVDHPALSGMATALKVMTLSGILCVMRVTPPSPAMRFSDLSDMIMFRLLLPPLESPSHHNVR